MSNNLPIKGRARVPFRKHPIVQAVTSKLTTDINTGRRGRNTGTGDVVPNYATLHNISQRTASSIRDAENMMAVMPDIALAESINTSSILSPNDLSETTITWKAEDLDIAPELISKMITIVEDFFNKDFPLADVLPDAIKIAKYRKGSYPMIVIPESTIDDIINGRDNVSMESLVTRAIFDPTKKGVPSLGILGPGLGPNVVESVPMSSLEQLFSAPPATAVDTNINHYTTVTDNPSALKLPFLADKIRQAAIASRYHTTTRGTSMEALHRARKSGLTKSEAGDITRMMNNLYNNRNMSAKEITRINTADKASRVPIGHPLAMVLPPESMIVVHTPGNPKDHIGYFLLLDDMGYPISTSTESTYYQDMVNKNQFSKDQVSQILNRTNQMINGAECTSTSSLQELRAAHMNYVELDLMERLRRGFIGDHVQIARPESIYDIMLARTYSKRRTQILWVPASLVMYFAFDYNEMGIGRSLLDKNRVMGMVRAALTFANAMGAMKNSSNHRTLTFRVDPADMTPEETLEKMYMEYTRINASSVPFSSSHPLDVIDQLSMANTSIKVEGAEDLLPDVSVDAQDSAGTRVQVDTEFLERVDKQFFMGLETTPSLMDATADIQFAVAAINENLLFSKRIREGQKITEHHWSEFARMFISNSGTLLSQMIKCIQEYRAVKDKKGVEYERAPGSRLKGQKPTEQVKEEVREKLYQKPEEPAMDPTATDTGEVDPNAVPEPEIDPELVQKDEAIYAVLTSNDTGEHAAADEMAIIDMFLSKLKMHLPKPDSTKLEDQMALLDKHEQAVDKFISIYFTDNLLSSICGNEADGSKDAIKDNFKALYLRQVIAENNILPQLQKLLDPTSEEAEGNTFDMEQHNVFLSGIFQTVKNMHEAIKARHSTPDELADDTTSSATDTAGSDTGMDGLDDMDADNDGLTDLDGDGKEDNPDAELDNLDDPTVPTADQTKVDDIPKDEPPPEEPELT